MVQSTKQLETINVVLTENRVHARDAEATVRNNGNEFISGVQTPMDLNFVKSNRNSWCWVSPKDVLETFKTKGWYKVDRENHKYISISEKEADKLEWHDKIYVYQSAIDMAKEGRPLALGVVYDDWVRLGLLGVYYDVDVARVAQAKPSQSPSSSQEKTALDVVNAELQQLKRTQEEKTTKASALETEAQQLRGEVSAIDSEIAKREKVAELRRS